MASLGQTIWLQQLTQTQGMLEVPSSQAQSVLAQAASHSRGLWLTQLKSNASSCKTRSPFGRALSSGSHNSISSCKTRSPFGRALTSDTSSMYKGEVFCVYAVLCLNLSCIGRSVLCLCSVVSQSFLYS